MPEESARNANLLGSFIRAQRQMANLSLRELIRISYGVMEAQLDAPAWTTTSVWDIVAKPPTGYESQQLPELLRNLLAEPLERRS